MSYLNKNLMPSEKLLYKCKIHWSIYLKGILSSFIGAILIVINFILYNNDNLILLILGAIIFLFGLYNIFNAFMYRISTELALTDKRVISKFGFIKRDTMELNHSKVESISIHQNILERMLNCGTVIVHGTGGGKTPIPSIDKPLEFRNKVIEILDNK